MRETRSSGSVEGVMSNRDPYSDCELSALPKKLDPIDGRLCASRMSVNESASFRFVMLSSSAHLQQTHLFTVTSVSEWRPGCGDAKLMLGRSPRWLMAQRGLLTERTGGASKLV